MISLSHTHDNQARGHVAAQAIVVHYVVRRGLRESHLPRKLH
jgi:hypothetical protein